MTKSKIRYNRIKTELAEQDLKSTDLYRMLKEKQVRVSEAKVWAAVANTQQPTLKLLNEIAKVLKVDITKTKELLNWTPPFTVKEGFSKTVKHFLKNK